MANVREIVNPIADKVDAAADAMHKANVGGHPTRGHEVLLRRISSSMRADAASGKTPHEFGDGIYASSDTSPEAAFAALPKKMQHALSDAGLRELLVDNGGVNLSRLDAAASKPNLSPSEKMAIKTGLINLGLLRAA